MIRSNWALKRFFSAWDARSADKFGLGRDQGLMFAPALGD
jgi:hypothetical protein